MTDIKTVHTTEQLLDMWDQASRRNDPHPQLAFARAIEAAVLASSAPAQEAVTDVSELRRFSVFEIEDGIYENQSGSYVLFCDVEKLLAKANVGKVDTWNAALERAAKGMEFCFDRKEMLDVGYVVESIRAVKRQSPQDQVKEK